MTPSNPSTQAIDRLQDKAQHDPRFLELLTASLKLADDAAQAQLNPELYRALPWPLDLSEYLAYLTQFARWAPRQSDDAAWTKPGTDEQQEVYDRLCHFYWLIDQEVGPDPCRTVESIPWFSEWLVQYAKAWGSFLDTTESFDDKVLQSFIELSPKYAVEDSMINGRPNAPSGWLTFNQFFARELNPGLRPIASPTDNRVVTSPADCTYKATYAIAADSTIPEITIKKTHTFASVQDLLKDSACKDEFANGTFAHYFLGPYSYHRFHTPVAGVVRECYPIQDLVYLEVALTDGQFDAPDSSRGGYEFTQARGVMIVDTAGSPCGDIGLVAVVPVGMCQVSSVNMTMTVGSNVPKGAEFGYFLFGGSDAIVLFQERADAHVDNGTHYRHYGSSIATCTAD